MNINKRIYLSPPHMSGHEMKYIKEAFRENWVAPLGPNVEGFEKELAQYLGVKHVAALSSGTAAIHLALILLGVQPGDYVIVQSFTFAATAFPVKYIGAIPVFVDSEPRTWNMDPILLEEAIINCVEGRGQRAEGRRGEDEDRRREEETSPWPPSKGESDSVCRCESESESRRKDYANSIRNSSQSIPLSAFRLPPALPKAIIPVHLYGMPANMDKIMSIADKYGIPVIEDAAEALGSEYKGRKCGSFGRLGILSFNGNKIITTSGGGALVSNDEELIKKARFLSTQARDPAPHYQHSQIGYNYRMSNIVAGIGRGQLEVISARVRARREIYNFYRSNLSEIKGVSFVEESDPEYFSNRWLTTILIDPDVTGVDRENVRVKLESENIETRPLWKPMHLQPVFHDCPAFVNGTSERLFNMGLCLPSGSNMTDEDRWRVVECLRESLKS